jgi:hypothetical protein
MHCGEDKGVIKVKNIQLSFNYGECIGLDDIKKQKKL